MIVCEQIKLKDSLVRNCNLVNRTPYRMIMEVLGVIQIIFEYD